MGLFSSKPAHKPREARHPRPKGAQKGVVKRDHQRGLLNFGGKARSPWVFSNDKPAKSWLW